jgi:hypothetical protein
MGDTVTFWALHPPGGTAWQAWRFAGTVACCASQKVTTPVFPVTSVALSWGEVMGKFCLRINLDSTKHERHITAQRSFAAAWAVLSNKNHSQNKQNHWHALT